MKAIFFCLIFTNALFSQIDLGCSSDHFNAYINSVLNRTQQYHEEAIRKLNKNAIRNIPSPKFIWPLRAAVPYDEIPNYYTISNFVDLDSDSIEILDYQCNERTYDKHRGIDITSFPFMWYMMDEEYVDVIAAADGIVTHVDDDNNNDSNCMGENSVNTSNNDVVITHSDGSRSIYYHIKSNSITVDSGDVVQAGDMIAKVASSGYSYGPHLHFEVRDINIDVIEPFVGNCNNTTNESWWQDQHPYWNPRVNRIMCHYNEPDLVGYNSSWCDTEHLFARNNYMPGENIYYGLAMADIQDGMEVEIDVYNSNGSNIFNDSYTHNSEPNNALYLVFNSSIPSGAPSGTYKVRVDIGQDEYYHYFTVNCPSSAIINNDLMGDNGFHVGTTLNISSELQEAGFPPSYENTDLKLQSGTEIKLTPGFHAPAGTYVWTRLRACNFTH